jgi:hypothetical protein
LHQFGCSNGRRRAFISLPAGLTDVTKLGDSKVCTVCGGRVILRLVQPSLTTLGWVDDGSIPYDTPPLPMWQCDVCDNQQPLEGELES